MTSRPQGLRRLFLSFLLPLLPALAAAQPASLVKDINTTVTGGTLDFLLRTGYTQLGSLVLFQADDGRHGHELWRTDGTEAGTTLLADICPGACPSKIYWKAVAGSRMFFSADDGAHGFELWVTDGTTAGTRMVVDLVPGLTGSNPFELVALGDNVLFTNGNGLDPSAPEGELWISDGTAAGTTVVADLWPGPEPSDPAFLGKIGSVLLFSAATPGEGRELWRSDGTTAGTSRLTDLNPGTGSFLPDSSPPFSRARYAAVSGSRLFFAADDGSHGRELWASDGTTAGTVPVKDIHPSGESFPTALVPFGAGVVFVASDGTSGDEVWISDGTPAGTNLLADVYPGPSGSGPRDLTLAGGKVYFRADDGITGRELWSTDGTTPGTALVADLLPGTGGAFSTLYPPTAYLAPNLLFFADDGVHGVELWRTDGSGAGTSLVADLDPGPGSSYFFNGPSDSEVSTVAGGSFYFSAYTAGSGFEVWLSDGTPAGTRKLKEINDQATSFPVAPYVGSLLGPRNLAGLGNTLLFGADDGAGQFELRKSDGAAAGTVKVSDGTPGTVALSPLAFQPLGGAALFSAEDGVHGTELWRTDGSSAGTFLVKDLDPAHSFSNGSPKWFAPLGAKVAFAGPDQAAWTTDGTNAGTQPIGGGLTFFAPPVPFGGALYFNGRSNDPTFTGPELWRTDGTLAGSSLILDIRTGANGSEPNNLTPAGGTLFFSASTTTAGRELWKSDGTAAGTVLLKDIRTGAQDGVPFGYSNDDVEAGAAWAALGSRVVFPADDGLVGQEPWVSDGTAAGTIPLGDLAAGARGSEPTWITAAAGRIFFVADDGVHGRELWMTDGTPAGNTLLDLAPGADSSLPAELRAIGRLLLFSAWEPAHGRELWVSDGSPGGTRRVQDAAPGALGASPMGMTAVGTQVYFVANDNTTGFELWKLPQAALGAALSATKTVAGFFYEGGSLTYTIVLRNDGLTLQPDAPGAELTDVLPAGLALTGASATAGTVTTSLATRTVTWNGTLAAGATVTLTLEATIQPGTLGAGLANQATLAWDADADGLNEASGVSDDPGATGSGDPTTLTVGPEALGFYTVTPCRVADTRTTTPLSFGVKRTFAIAGSCGIPSTARAVAANLTLVGATGTGSLVAWKAGAAQPGTSNANFKVGAVRGNNSVLSLGSGAVDALALAGGSGTVQLVIDVSGYFQ